MDGTTIARRTAAVIAIGALLGAWWQFEIFATWGGTAAMSFETGVAVLFCAALFRWHRCLWWVPLLSTMVVLFLVASSIVLPASSSARMAESTAAVLTLCVLAAWVPRAWRQGWRGVAGATIASIPIVFEAVGGPIDTHAMSNPTMVSLSCLILSRVLER